MSVPRNRDTIAGDDTRGSNAVRITYPTYQSVGTVKKRAGPKPVNRFFQIGITNRNALSCHDPRDAKSAVSQGVEFGDYKMNVKQELQIRSYQSNPNTSGYMPHRPIITGVKTG